jgi:hypothetical protein
MAGGEAQGVSPELNPGNNAKKKKEKRKKNPLYFLFLFLH